MRPANETQRTPVLELLQFCTKPVIPYAEDNGFLHEIEISKKFSGVAHQV